MRSLLAVLVLASVANPDTASCRVNARPTDWSETRTMLPAGGAPTAIHVEACVFFEQTVALENLWVFQGTRWQVSNLGIVFEAAFDPAFQFPLIPPTTVTVPDVFGAVGPFDGVIDQAGTSGEAIRQEAQALVVADLAVADPTYFQQPWPVYVRTTTLPYTQQSASPAMVFVTTANAGAGVVVTYQ